jgi:MoaA/NifB/PqqE/SkfB family radical SAM enzyme
MTNKEFSKFYGDYINRHKEKGISVDATNVCPLECPFCPRQRETHKKKIKSSIMIPVKDYKKIVKFCNKKIRLCGQISDPIYHPKFLEIIQIAKINPTKLFSIHTNGTRRKISWWKTIFQNTSFNTSFIFGLDGTDQETANIYRVNTRYDEVMEVMKLGVSMGVKVIWQFIVFKHNEHQVENAIRIAKENNIILEFIKSDEWYPELVEKYNIHPPSDKWVTRNENGQTGFIRQTVWIAPK